MKAEAKQAREATRQEKIEPIYGYEEKQNLLPDPAAKHTDLPGYALLALKYQIY